MHVARDQRALTPRCVCVHIQLQTSAGLSEAVGSRVEEALANLQVRRRRGRRLAHGCPSPGRRPSSRTRLQIRERVWLNGYCCPAKRPSCTVSPPKCCLIVSNPSHRFSHVMNHSAIAGRPTPATRMSVLRPVSARVSWHTQRPHTCLSKLLIVSLALAVVIGVWDKSRRYGAGRSRPRRDASRRTGSLNPAPSTPPPHYSVVVPRPPSKVQRAPQPATKELPVRTRGRARCSARSTNTPTVVRDACRTRWRSSRALRASLAPTSSKRCWKTVRPPRLCVPA